MPGGWPGSGLSSVRYTEVFDYTPGDFEVVNDPNHGAQGDVHLVRRIGSSNESGLYVRKTEDTPESGSPIEGRILLELLGEHDCIVKLHRVFMKTPVAPLIQLFFEHCDLGDLANLTMNYAHAGKIVPEPFVWHVFQQLSDALAFIHYGGIELAWSTRPWNQVIHRDIKPANVFLKTNPADPNRYPQIKLGDFGLSAPPEREKSSVKSDVWALGATIYYLCEGGSTPIHIQNPSWLHGSPQEDWEESVEARQPKPILSNYSHMLRSYVEQTLDRNPKTRIDSRVLAQELSWVAPEQIKHKFEPLMELGDILNPHEVW